MSSSPAIPMAGIHTRTTDTILHRKFEEGVLRPRRRRRGEGEGGGRREKEGS